MAVTSVAGLAPQLENYHLAEPDSDVAKLSIARATNPLAWITHDVAMQEMNDRNAAYDKKVDQNNALRAALMDRVLKSEQLKSMQASGHSYLSRTADAGSFMAQLFPDLAPQTFLNPAQQRMDSATAAAPGMQNLDKGADILHKMNQSGFPLDFAPGEIAGMMTGQSLPNGLRYDPSATQGGYNSRVAADAKTAPQVKTTFTDPTNTTQTSITQRGTTNPQPNLGGSSTPPSTPYNTTKRNAELFANQKGWKVVEKPGRDQSSHVLEYVDGTGKVVGGAEIDIRSGRKRE
jgi:hypothetical protein